MWVRALIRNFNFSLFCPIEKIDTRRLPPIRMGQAAARQFPIRKVSIVFGDRKIRVVPRRQGQRDRFAASRGDRPNTAERLVRPT